MIPSYLYHYTSVETLLLILSNNTIRFNTLNKMNDPIEGHTSKYPDSRSYVFASCWTAESREELPMWKMYTDLEGVRFKMPIDLFNVPKDLSITKCLRTSNYLISSELNKSYAFERKNMSSADFSSNKVYGPTQIEYFESKDSLEKDIVRKDDKQKFDFYEINLNLLGQRKLDYWQFEKEYRYRMFYASAIMLAGSTEVLESGFKDTPLTTTYIDVNFKRESLENIEIILGPKTDKSNKKLIEDCLIQLDVKSYTVKFSEIEIQ